MLVSDAFFFRFGSLWVRSFAFGSAWASMSSQLQGLHFLEASAPVSAWGFGVKS